MNREPMPGAGGTRQGHFNRREVLMMAGVLLLTVAAYAQVLGFPFTGLDDSFYVGPDTPMSHGLSWANVWYAFTHLHFHFYYPLTLLSHMADAQLWGQWAGGHHATNLLLHLLCVILVYACLRLPTGRAGPSAMVAALFALHPFHVEAVVWIAERKELLCTFFTLLALLAYGAYTHHRSANRYLLVTLLFVAALLSKPMAVTLPAVFLLVDLWPLERLNPEEWRAAGKPGLRGELSRAWDSFWPLLREKLPWFAISLAFSALTIVANRAGGGLTSLATLPLPWRVGNALYAYGQYIAKTFLPAGLAIYYPHPGRALPIGTALASGLGLLLLIVLGILWRKKAPYLVAGILFFIVTLLPVIGILQVGSLQSYADRYTYFSLLGLFVPLAWGAADWAGIRRVRRSVLVALSLAIILALAGACWHQVHTWRNDRTLFGRDLTLYPKNNYVAWSIMGSVYLNRGQVAMARKAFENALAIAPGLTTARVKLGNLLADQGDFRRAEACFKRVIHETGGSDSTAVYGLGRALALEGRVKEAVPLLRRAWKLNPFMAQAPIALASILRNSGQPKAALDVLHEAATDFPGHWLLQANLGLTLEVLGRTNESLEAFRRAVRLGGSQARENVASMMVAPEHPPEALCEAALGLVQKTIQDDPARWPLWSTLARVYCALGRPDEAAKAQRRAVALAAAQGGEGARRAAVRKAPPCLGRTTDLR